LVQKFSVTGPISREYFAKGTDLQKIQKVLKAKGFTYFNSALAEVEDEELK
jgi:hypothetical protein